MYYIKSNMVLLPCKHRQVVKLNAMGALFYEKMSDNFMPIYVDATVFATGGQNCLVRIMNEDLGILRTGSKLLSVIDNIDEILSQCNEITGDGRILPYLRYSLKSMVILGRAILICSEKRRETRVAHIRDDYPENLNAYENCTIISYNGGK